MRYRFQPAIFASAPLDKRDWRWHLTSALSQRLQKYTVMAVHTKTHRRRFQIYPLWRAFLNLCVYGECFHRLRVDGRPKRIKKFAFTLLRLQSSSCGQGLRVDVVQGNSNMALIIAGWACIYNINYLQSWAWVKMNAVILTQFSPASILASKYFFSNFFPPEFWKWATHSSNSILNTLRRHKPSREFRAPSNGVCMSISACPIGEKKN